MQTVVKDLKKVYADARSRAPRIFKDENLLRLGDRNDADAELGDLVSA
jgi:hypothetical protein